MTLRSRTTMLVLALFALAAMTLATPARAQADRDAAIALYNSGKQAEAAAAFEALVKTGKADATVYEMLGYYVLSNSGTYADAAKRKTERVRARQLLEKAISLGAKSERTRDLVESGIPKDGGEDPKFSGNREVDSLMRHAYAASASRDYKAARVSYTAVLAAQADNYNAALRLAQTYLDAPPLDSAYYWYERATEIDPNQETAWRLWSDLLFTNRRNTPAKDKAIEAVVSEPYNVAVLATLGRWAKATGTEFAYPHLELKNDAKRVADSVRKVWRGEGAKKPGAPFTAAYSAELTYRHSLAEEHEALTAAAAAGGDDPGAQLLKKLTDSGTLDAFVLLSLADAGITKDYDKYRRNHRAELRKFWLEFVIGAPYGKK